MEVKTVWVVIEMDPDEGDVVRGVYTDRDRAKSSLGDCVWPPDFQLETQSWGSKNGVEYLIQAYPLHEGPIPE